MLLRQLLKKKNYFYFFSALVNQELKNFKLDLITFLVNLLLNKKVYYNVLT